MVSETEPFFITLEANLACIVTNVGILVLLYETSQLNLRSRFLSKNIIRMCMIDFHFFNFSYGCDCRHGYKLREGGKACQGKYRRNKISIKKQHYLLLLLSK